MSILFSAIAKRTSVLAQYAACTGNFSEATNQILKMIPPHDNKMTYSSDPYLFHYIAENNLIFFCITDTKLPQGDAFAFLNEIKRIFLVTFADTPQSSKLYASPNHPKYIDFIGILETKMAAYKIKENKLSVNNVRTELAELKNVMMENVHKVALRGERLDLLMQRADVLSQTSVTFVTSARQVKRKVWWQYIRWYIIAVVIGLSMVYFIGAMACGGLEWRNCIG